MKREKAAMDTALRCSMLVQRVPQKGSHINTTSGHVKPKLLDLKDAANYLGLSETRVREYVNYGKLKSVTLPHPFKLAKDTRKLLIEISGLDAL